MELAQLEAFARAAELESFTKAARQLHLSPSALSRRVAQLEDEVGVRLLLRTTRAVRLSDEGRVFLEQTRRALRELREAQELAASAARKPAGLLRIEAPTMMGRYLVVPALARFTVRHPSVRVQLGLRDVASDLVTGAVDVALRHGPLEASGLVARKVGTSRMRVCAAPRYLRRAGTPRTVDALLQHERLGLSMHGRPLPWRLRDGPDEREVPAGDRVVVDSGEALIDLAVAGTGIAWACDFMTARAEAAGELVEILEKTASVELPVYVVTLPGRAALPKVRVFVEFLQAELARLARR